MPKPWFDLELGGVLDKFFTQEFSIILSCAWLVLFCLVELLWFLIWVPCNLVYSPSLICFLYKSLSNFSYFLFRVLKCCFSFPISINSLQLFIQSSLKTLSRLSIHVSHWDFNMFKMLLIDLTLSFSNAISASLVI